MRTAIFYEPPTDVDTCRGDILGFLKSITWRIALVEVKLWTANGEPFDSRLWSVENNEPAEIAEQISMFVRSSSIPVSIIVIVDGETDRSADLISEWMRRQRNSG